VNLLRTLSLILLMAGVGLISGTAMAADPECDSTGLDAAGRCVPASNAVEWCTDDGEYRLLHCVSGDICAEGVDARGEIQGFTCIDRLATECADVPDEGKCASPEVLVWCNAGRVESKSCEGDTECGWDGTDQEHDCVAKGAIPTGDEAPEASEAGPEPQPEAAPELPTPGELTAGGPKPGVEPGGGFVGGGGGGDCQSGSGQGGWLWASVLLLALATRRRC